MKKGAGVILYTLNESKVYVLLGKRLNNPGRGSWGIPGGGMEDYDCNDFQETAIRECFEETEILIKKPLVLFDELSFGNLNWRTYIKEIPSTTRNTFRCEMEESNWFEINNLPNPLVSHLEDELLRLNALLSKNS